MTSVISSLASKSASHSYAAFSNGYNVKTHRAVSVSFIKSDSLLSSKISTSSSEMFAQSLTPLRSFPNASTSRPTSNLRPAVRAAVIQFIRGVDEQTIPEVKLTRARDGSSGTATFSFDQPSVFDSSKELGDITGLYMIDEEGVLQTVDVSAKFVNGKPSRVEAYFVMKSEREWDRFLRFMERYSQEKNLGFTKS